MLNTQADAMNQSGQVFGAVMGPGTVQKPVLWTDGVGTSLPIPNGYYWDWNDQFGTHFINDSGLVVSRVRIPNGVPGISYDESRVVLWQNGVPQVLEPPDSCGLSGHRFMAPWGLNNQGHIIFTNFGDNNCGKLWMWDGTAYHVVFDTANNTTYGFMALAHSHLNDADHVAIDRVPLTPQCSPTVTVTGILAEGQFTPITPGTATAINNHDQVLLFCTSGSQVVMKLWDGTTVVDFGFGGYAGLNDRGQVVFMQGNPGSGLIPKIYKDGLVSDLSLPPLPQTLLIVSGSLINASGQIVVSETLLQPNGGVAVQAVQFTPRTPVITWPTPADITYGTALGPTQLNATANVPGTFVYTPTAGTVLHAGPQQTVSLTFTPSDLTHYDQTTASVSINVQPAPLSVAADDASKVFGAPLPAFSASFTGFVNGDGPGSLAGTLTLTTTATPASPAGPYPIVPSGVSSPDYTIGFVPGTLTIAPANTTTTAFAFPTTAGFFQPLILIASVAPVAPGSGLPDGTLQFKDGPSLLGTATLANGFAFLLANGLVPGPHTLTAAYGGSHNFASSTSPPVNVTVQSAPTSTFTLLIPATNPQAAGQPAVFAAVVIGLGGGAAPAGPVQFTDGNTSLGTATLNGSGVAVFSTSALGAGTHMVGARYLGGGIYSPSSASPILQTIFTGAPPASTAVSLLPPNPALVDEPLTFTATVTGGATTGDVTFFIDGFALGQAPVANVGGSFQATFTLTGLLSAGTHVVSAAYAGSPGFAASSLLVPAVQTIQLPGRQPSESPDALVTEMTKAIRRVLRK